jgi:Uncharacterised nucleotidyltransferase
MSPSPKSIAQALGRATERFAAELVQPQPCAPSWTEFEWHMARAAAVLHGVSPLLAGKLRWAGPSKWQQFLEEQREQTLRRHLRIEAVLEGIDGLARARGVAVVPLKGAALHALGLYCAGERPMADIDLLVQEEHVAGMRDVLSCLGYVQTANIWKHRMFEPQADARSTDASNVSPRSLPLGEHEDYPIKVDLHTRIAERLPLQETAITDLVFPARPRPGLNPYPSRLGLLLHLLLHAAGNMGGHTLRLLQLHDIVLHIGQMSPDDWEPLMNTPAELQGLWWAYAPVSLVERYRPGLVPASVRHALRAACPRALRHVSERRTLTQWSYAKVFVPAFPGLVWSRSLREGLRYVSGRLWPGPEQLANRRIIAAEQWAAPSAWAHMSQGQRVVQWLFARPPRQASMYIVRAALESPQPD